MQIANHPNKHLTYCSNIHPGESWPDLFRQLKQNLPELKQRLSPESAFGVGLRLSAEAARELKQNQNLRKFKQWLSGEDLYVFTINGFPYGNFHGERVKDNVYKPDWTTSERVEYTVYLAKILSKLLPEGMDGGISTSPLSYKPWLKNTQREEVYRLSCRNMANVAHLLGEISKNRGTDIHIDIEPEPDCLLENTAETIEYFQEWLFTEGAAHLADKYAYEREEAAELLRNHIRVCYDTCHFAVEYEDPAEVVRQFREAGITIGKVQISAALKVDLQGMDEKAVISALKPFEEDTYLHQVIERRSDNTFRHYPDLSDALENGLESPSEEWRIHFHVPIFVDSFGDLQSTQDDIVTSLSYLLEGECTHFEIETYTWEVLPDDLKAPLVDSIEREIKWTKDVMHNT